MIKAISINEIEWMINDFSKEKTSSPDVINGKFYQHLKKKFYQPLQSLPEQSIGNTY